MDNDSDVRAARVVKGRLEKTTLGQIAKHIKTVLRSTSCYLSVKLDLEAIEALQLEIDVRTVYQSILETTKLRLKDKHVTVRRRAPLRLFFKRGRGTVGEVGGKREVGAGDNRKGESGGLLGLGWRRYASVG